MQEDFNRIAQEWDNEQYRHDRARQIADQMRRRMSLTATMRVLEFGCGTGLLGFNLAPHVASVTFADTSEGMLAQVSEKIKQNGVGNATTLLLDANQHTLPQQYDVIVTLMALHHINDYEAVIAMFAAHLATNGWLGIADLDEEDGSFHTHVEVPHHGFDRQHLQQLFGQNNLTNIQESTPYVMKRQVGAAMKEFPVFLMTGQKADAPKAL